VAGECARLSLLLRAALDLPLPLLPRTAPRLRCVFVCVSEREGKKQRKRVCAVVCLAVCTSWLAIAVAAPYCASPALCVCVCQRERRQKDETECVRGCL